MVVEATSSSKRTVVGTISSATEVGTTVSVTSILSHGLKLA